MAFADSVTARTCSCQRRLFILSGGAAVLIAPTNAPFALNIGAAIPVTPILYSPLFIA